MITMMITAPAKDFGGTIAGIQFKDGVGEAPEGFEHIHYFMEHGYTVGEPAAVGPEFPDGDPSEEWKANELKAYAAAKGFDLAGATNKKAIVDAIAAAAAATAAAQA